MLTLKTRRNDAFTMLLQWGFVACYIVLIKETSSITEPPEWFLPHKCVMLATANHLPMDVSIMDGLRGPSQSANMSMGYSIHNRLRGKGGVSDMTGISPLLVPLRILVTFLPSFLQQLAQLGWCMDAGSSSPVTLLKSQRMKIHASVLHSPDGSFDSRWNLKLEFAALDWQFNSNLQFWIALKFHLNSKF